LIFTELEAFLKDVSDEKKIMDQSDWTKLANHLKNTMHCLESFDGLFSRLRSTPSEQKPATELLSKAAAFLEAGLKYWRILGLSITPKIHMLEPHFAKVASSQLYEDETISGNYCKISRVWCESLQLALGYTVVVKGV